MAAFVRGALQDGVTTLTLARAEALNALSPPLMAGLAQALRAAGDDERTRAIVLTGAAAPRRGDTGRFGEVLAGGGLHAREIGRYMEVVATRCPIAECPVPVVAAVNGPVLAVRSASRWRPTSCSARSAYFLVPQVPTGRLPDLGATWLLSRLLGRSRALASRCSASGSTPRRPSNGAWSGAASPMANCRPKPRPWPSGWAARRRPRCADTRRLIDAAPAHSLEQQLACERTAQRRHVAGPFFHDACARFLARAGARH